MLDETLPPAGETEPAAPADDHAGVTASAADAAPASPAPQEAAVAAADTDAAAPAAATDGAATAQDLSPETAPAAPAPELSPAACAAELAKRFPALFAAGRALPIKLRIQADIQARAPGVFTRKAMSLFLHRYTTSTAYLKALVGSPHRFDLDGAPAGDVAAEHREAAQVEVQRRQAIVQERRAAERRADRPPRQRPGPQSGPVAASSGDAPTGDAVQPTAPAPGDRPRPPQRPRDDRRPPAPRNRDAGGQRPQGPRADVPARPPRPTAQPQQQRRDGREAVAADAQREQRHAALAGLPPAEIEARRDRASLLRAYESSTLTKANFCVLKRVAEADLDAALALARQERGEAPPRPSR